MDTETKRQLFHAARDGIRHCQLHDGDYIADLSDGTGTEVVIRVLNKTRVAPRYFKLKLSAML